MFPSECVLERRVLSGDLAPTDLLLLQCNDTKAEGYAEDKLEIYNQRLKGMKIGVRLADAPPAVSYLAILGDKLSGEIVAFDKTVIVISMGFVCEGGSPRSYLIYDAVALSLRMIPPPNDPSWLYTLSSRLSVARPCRGPDYALVHIGRLGAGGEDSFFLWRPSSSSPPWSEYKKPTLPLYRNGWRETNTPFSFNGHTYRVDLLRGVFCFSCDALFDDKSSSVEKFISLPVEPQRQRIAEPRRFDQRQRIAEPRRFDQRQRIAELRRFDQRQRIAEPAAYRTMGVVRDSFIRFVSINGFQDYVELKKRTVTVWKLVGHDKGWVMEHEFSLKALWGFEGFGDVPKDLTPMYPLLSTKNMDIVYLGLGDYHETKIVQGSLPPEWEFFPNHPRYMLAVDMRNKIVRTSLPLEERSCLSLGLVSCSFSRYLRKALLGPCDDEGVPILMKKKPRRDAGTVAEAPAPMKKKPRLEKPKLANILK